ncbi:hypothetical protein [Opitutus sp. ER46]|uniref:TlpA family protein disulfide reductase n=1 Tax=Opitutus sp. ER46 TaxID=2161864 RepID=UPI000D302FC0|nr:hypothetical protein [Opitutus sp. ER46]PTY01164.1 hypothetical protein DB354_00535 [Opitutus sp. ER46]
MKLLPWLVGLGVITSAAWAGEPSPVEQQVAEAVKAPTVTIVHLWAPWCPNCTAELKPEGWPAFLTANPDVKVIFVTVWAGKEEDGRALLEKQGVGAQPNFQLLMHPNTSRKKADRMTHFLGQPVTWLPTTWIYRGGTLRYALNYGEVRFGVLSQLVRDAQDKWEH